MTQQDDIKELKKKIEELDKFRTDILNEEEVEEKVKAIIKVRCAAAWGAIFSFVSAIIYILGGFSDVMKDAAKAALKIIIARLSS